MGSKANNDLALSGQQTETNRKPRNINDLQFLNQHLVPSVPGANPRSKSHFINNFNKSGARAASGGTHAGMLRMRKHLYDQNRQIMRYKNLNKSSNLATRLNRPMPANTNFPEEDVRNKFGSGFETSKKYKLSDVKQLEQQNMSHDQNGAGLPKTAIQSSVMSFSGGSKTTAGYPVTWDYMKKPSTAINYGRRGNERVGNTEYVARNNTASDGQQNDFNQDFGGYQGVGTSAHDTESF